MAGTKQVIFLLGDNRYSLDIQNVITVENYIPADKMADAPENVKGIINLRGERLPVYDLRTKFSLGYKEPDNDTILLIVHSNGLKVAYEADRMEGISEIEAEQIYAVPPIAKDKNTSYMKNVINLEGQLIIQLDPDKILSEEELKGINARQYAV